MKVDGSCHCGKVTFEAEISLTVTDRGFQGAINVKPSVYHKAFNAVVGQGGDRAFWTTSTPPGDSLYTARWGSTYFTIPYWTDVVTTHPGGNIENFAFEITGDPLLPDPVLSA